MSKGVEVKGLAELERRLKAFSERISEDLKGLDELAHDIHEFAQKNCPKDTGELASSIYIKKQEGCTV